MILFNFFGTPGAGKTTASADLFVTLKKAGYEVELVGESARFFLYMGAKQPLLDNQFLVSAIQWELIKRLDRSGTEIAICECPVIQGSLYSEHLPYQKELKALLQKCHEEFQTYNILVKRIFPYMANVRYQTQEEADAMLPTIRSMAGKFWLEIDGNEKGLTKMRDSVFEVLAIPGL